MRPLGTNGPSGGILTAVKKTIPHKRLQLVTDLQALAITTLSNHPSTLCNIYLPPTLDVKIEDLEDLLSQLPTPLILMGDFVAHNQMWKSRTTNARGRVLENIFTQHNLHCLNDGRNTFYRPHDQASSIIDLTLTTANLALDYEWDTLPFLYGSDHYPIILRRTKQETQIGFQNWQIQKANWPKFKEQQNCIGL